MQLQTYNRPTFSTHVKLQTIKNIQKQALPYFHGDFEIGFIEFAQKSNKNTMTTQRLELLGTENHKMKKGLNPVFMSYLLSYHPVIGLHVNITF